MRAVKTTSRLLKPKNLEILRKFETAANKNQTQVAAVFQSVEEQSEWDAAKPFHSIPGPRPLPIPYIGNAWRFLPFGTYGNLDLGEAHQKLYEQYGPIVMLDGFGKYTQILLFDPVFVEKMFRNESIWPMRVALDSLKYYRTVVRKDYYEHREGLVTSQGEEWQNFRTATNQTMMQPKNVTRYLTPMAEVLDEFLERIRFIRDEKQEMPDDFMNELNKMALESFANVTLDVRLGCFSKDLSPDSDAMIMINNVKESFRCMHILDLTPYPWRYIPTPVWRKFVKVMDEILEISRRHVYAKWEMIKKQGENEDNSSKSILENLLLKTKDPKIPIVMATDTLFAGIDTTSNTVGTTLYFLAINPEKQEIMYRELKKLLPEKNSPITQEIFNELKYTRAVIKESMRMKPTSLANQRMAMKDMVLGGYQIPKGTFLLAGNGVMCQMEKHYKNPTEFIPERWLKSESKSDISSKKAHPFVFLPFGFGQRSCIGRRLAEMEMEIALSKIIRNFKVSYNYGSMTWALRLLYSPSKPLKFKMEDRPE